jgi:hypothetical protein
LPPIFPNSIEEDRKKEGEIERKRGGDMKSAKDKDRWGDCKERARRTSSSRFPILCPSL